MTQVRKEEKTWKINPKDSYGFYQEDTINVGLNNAFGVC